MGAATLPSEAWSCPFCSSSRKMKFNGEVCLHFVGGLESLNKPLVWVYPETVVCVDCGLAQFYVPDSELRTLNKGAAT
jgi:hypothetical protein